MKSQHDWDEMGRILRCIPISNRFSFTRLTAIVDVMTKNSYSLNHIEKKKPKCQKSLPQSAKIKTAVTIQGNALHPGAS